MLLEKVADFGIGLKMKLSTEKNISRIIFTVITYVHSYITKREHMLQGDFLYLQKIGKNKHMSMKNI